MSRINTASSRLESLSRVGFIYHYRVFNNASNYGAHSVRTECAVGAHRVRTERYNYYNLSGA
jgi:hypothetical protein